MHMISKKDLNDAEMDTLTKSCSPTIVKTTNGEVQTHEEAPLDTPPILSIGKLSDEHGYSHEWINGQIPHLIKKLYSDAVQHRELRSDRSFWFTQRVLPQPCTTTVSSDGDTREREEQGDLLSKPSEKPTS